MKIQEVTTRAGFISIMYRDHTHEREELELERMRMELDQLRAEVMGTVADARYDVARARETDAEAELTRKQKQYIERIF